MKNIIKRFENLFYALAMFFYIDMAVIATACTSAKVIEHYEIKRDAKSILDTPNLIR